MAPRLPAEAGCAGGSSRGTVAGVDRGPNRLDAETAPLHGATVLRHSPGTGRRVALSVSLCLASAAVPAPAAADEPPPVPGMNAPELDAASLPASLRERPAPGPTPWRAVAEEASLLALSLVVYANTPAAKGGGAHAVPFLDKLRLAHGAWGYDTDPLVTNYLGHPLAGLCYDQVARGNRLGAGASLGLTLASAWTWEVVEYQEAVSVHDVVSTTAGGFALGEAFGQLSTWLGQREGLLARTASIVFQLPRAIHDRLDEVPPDPPVRFGVADVAAWGAAGGSTGRAGGEAAEVRVGARARLVRADEVGAPGTGWRMLLDANVTSLTAELAAGRPGVVGFDLVALASLVGLYGRAFDASGDGQDLLLTASLGFDYLSRTEPVGVAWADDCLALVRTPGVELVAGLRRGGLRAELGLEAALTLGGVQPLALHGRPTGLPGAPGVLRLRGYYHGLGGLLAPRAALVLGPVEVAAAWRLDRLEAVHDHDFSPPPDGGRLALEDERRDLRIRLAWRPGAGTTQLFGTWERRDGWGRAGQATAAFHDSTVLVGVAVSN